MKIIVAIAFYFLYWGVCFLGTGTDKKNLMGLRSYPEEVQNRVRSDHQGCSEEEIHRCRLAQQSFAFHSRVFRFRTCAERRAELGRLSVGILVLSCVQRGAWVVRSFGDRSSLVAQHKTYPLLFPAGEEILSKSEKAYRIVLARYPVVCRSRCTVSLDRHGVLNHTS